MSIDRIKQLIEMIESDNFVIDEAINKIQADRDSLETLFEPEKQSLGKKMLTFLGVKPDTAVDLIGQVNAGNISAQQIASSVLDSPNYVIMRNASSNAKVESTKGDLEELPKQSEKIMEVIYSAMKKNNLLFSEINEKTLKAQKGYEYEKINDEDAKINLKDNKNLEAIAAIQDKIIGNFKRISIKKDSSMDAVNFNNLFQDLNSNSKKSGVWNRAEKINNTINLIF